MYSASGEVTLNLRAIDNMTGVFDKISGSVQGLTESFANIGRAALSNYQGFLQIERAGVMVERSNLAVSRATKTLSDSQDAYNIAVSKFSADSPQAQKALTDLNIATEALTVAEDRARVSQDNLNTSMLSMAVYILPQLTNPMGQLALLASGAMYAINGISDAMGESAKKHAEFIQRLTEIDDALKTHNNLLKDSIDSYAQLSQAANVSATNLPKLKSELEYVNAELADMNKQLQFAGTAQQRNALQLQIGADIKALQDRKTQLEAAIKVEENWIQKQGEENEKLQEQTKALEDATAAIKPYQDAIAELTKTYNESIAEASLKFSTFADDFEAAFGAGKITEAVDVAQLFGNQFNLSLDSAIRILENFTAEATKNLPQVTDIFEAIKIAVGQIPKTVEESTKALEKLGESTTDAASSLFDKLQNQWNIEQATASASKYVDVFARAWKSGLMISVMAAANQFALAFNINLEDAVNILDALMKKLADVGDSANKTSDTLGRAVYKWNQDMLSWVDVTKGWPADLTQQGSNIYEGGPGQPSTSTLPTVSLDAVKLRRQVNLDRLNTYLQSMGLAEGGIVTRPTLAMVGEAGPEAIIPLAGGGGLGSNVTINLTVQGSVDRRTAEYAAKLIEDRLKNVLVEPSSVSGSSTHKRIRFGS